MGSYNLDTSLKCKDFKTTDDGENWFVQLQQSPADDFTSIFFVDSLNGWATSRYVWQTTNGGIIGFSEQIYPSHSSAMIFISLIQLDTLLNSWIYIKQQIPVITGLLTLSSQYVIRTSGWLDNRRGFIIGDGVYETVDSGNTWNEI